MISTSKIFPNCCKRRKKREKVINDWCACRVEQWWAIKCTVLLKNIDYYHLKTSLQTSAPLSAFCSLLLITRLALYACESQVTCLSHDPLISCSGRVIINLRWEDERRARPTPLNDPRTRETFNCCLWSLYHFIKSNYRVKLITSPSFSQDGEELGPRFDSGEQRRAEANRLLLVKQITRVWQRSWDLISSIHKFV